MDLAITCSPDEPIEIVDHDPSWPKRFAAEAARLAKITVGVSWHHIGSTAVPGLAAKPVIDMMAVVDRLDALVTPLVEQAGYEFPATYNATLADRRCPCRPTQRIAHITFTLLPTSRS